jgi:hypothetical protein
MKLDDSVLQMLASKRKKMDKDHLYDGGLLIPSKYWLDKRLLKKMMPTRMEMIANGNRTDD